MQLQKNNSDSILNNNNIIFDQAISAIGDISYDNVTGVITISENGLYMIDWSIAMQATSGSLSVIFKLISDQGHEFNSDSPTKTGSLSGIAVLNVDDAPIHFSLVNASNATVFFSNTIISKATLRVFFLNDNVIDNSRCFALDQFAHVLEQVVTLYQGATVSIFASNRLATVTGQINSLYKAPDAGSIPLLLLGSEPVALSIDKLALLYFPNSVYDDSITYLDPPDPFPQNCDTDLLKDIHSYVEVGDTISITVGATASASGDVYINEYGIIVLADAVSMLILVTPHIYSLVIDQAVDSARNEKSISVSNIYDEIKKVRFDSNQ